MTISLQKGGNVSLSKSAPGLNQISIGLGWDIRVSDGDAFDLDASVFLLTEAGKVRSDADVIYYDRNHLKSPCGSVEHTGDNRTGAGDGDDETINVKLNSLPAHVAKIAIVVSMHNAESLGQNFGQVSSAFVRIVNTANNEEIVRYDLSEEASTHTAIIFAELYRYNGEWKFKSVGQGFAGNLAAVARNYGIDVE